MERPYRSEDPRDLSVLIDPIQCVRDVVVAQVNSRRPLPSAPYLPARREVGLACAAGLACRQRARACDCSPHQASSGLIRPHQA